MADRRRVVESIDRGAQDRDTGLAEGLGQFVGQSRLSGRIYPVDRYSQRALMHPSP